MVCAGIFVRAATPDQPVGDMVGLIEGEDIAVTGPMSVEVVGGIAKTSLQSVIVPQGGDVTLANGQIDALGNGSGHCACELEVAKAPAVPLPRNVMSARTMEGAKGETVQNSGDAARAGEKSSKKEEPIYTVDMPPLRFDATAKVQPEPDPRLMVIVRRVRVRPTLIFQGQVEGEMVATAAATPAPTVVTRPTPSTPPQAQGSGVDRVRVFFRRLWTRGGEMCGLWVPTEPLPAPAVGAAPGLGDGPIVNLVRVAAGAGFA